MEKIFVNKKGKDVFLNSYLENNRVNLPPLGEGWTKVDAKHAAIKVGEKKALWNPNMAAAIAKWEQSGSKVNLTEGYQIRIGVGIALVTDDKGPVVIETNSTHPTRPNKITPPAGLWQSGTPLENALGELGEELIIIDTITGRVGNWRFNEKILGQKWVNEFIENHKPNRGGGGPVIDIEMIRTSPHYPEQIFFEFGDEVTYVGCVAFEPDSGSLEIIFPFRPVYGVLPPNVKLADGERLPDGTWLNRRVFYQNFTSKASAIFEAFGIKD